MKRKNLFGSFKILAINLLVLFLLLEAFSRAILHYKSEAFEKKGNDAKMREYLSFVNHSRIGGLFTIDWFKEQEKIEGETFSYPHNINDSTHQILSILSACDSLNPNRKTKNWFADIKNSKCKTLIAQGDSWGEGQIAYARNTFKSFTENNWNVIHGGTSSFSVANYSGQLAFLVSQGITPSAIYVNIDQSDLGDDLVRYKNKISHETFPIPHTKVKPFGFAEHTAFYNYFPYYPDKEIPNLLSLRPHLPTVIKTSINILSTKALWQFDNNNFAKTPRWSQIKYPLLDLSDKNKKYFKEILSKYIITASKSGAKLLVITTHPHYPHLMKLTDKDLQYKNNVSDLVQEVVGDPSIKNLSNFTVHHIRMPNNLINCSEESDLTCNGYFAENDRASHPSPSGYRIYGEFINDNLEKHINNFNF